jgi:large subunit ribosomal protein L10e
MVKKPGRMYREIKQQAYTRKEYMGGIPMPRITQFDLGDKKASFPIEVSLVCEERCQIRHTALEAARIAANRYLEKNVGKAGYRLKIRIYPHHVLRENKQATGAGADRVSQGMRASFGKAVGTAARVEAGQAIITVGIKEEHINIAKDALRRAGMKIPSPFKINVVKKVEAVKSA